MNAPAPVTKSPYPGWGRGLLAAWTIMVIFSLGVDIQLIRQNMLEQGRSLARGNYNKDIVYRRWAARSGGAYLPRTDKTPPNRYLAGNPERDITTPSGKELTLVNPAYMTRQVHELERELHGARSHITSLTPIRPENEPDPWERRALKSFAQGQPEFSELTLIDNAPFMRLMRPVRTEKPCLKCHTTQGYKVGDIQGGISVSVPMAELITASHRQTLIVGLIHLLLWLAGSTTLFIGGRRLTHYLTMRIQAEENLRQRSMELDQRVRELRCLYAIANLLQRQDRQEDELLRETVDILPTGFRTPSSIGVRLTIGDRLFFATDNFRVSERMLSEPLLVSGRQHATLEVSVVAPEMPTSPFLDEERKMVKAVAEQLTTVLERQQTRETTLRLEKQLRQAQKMEAVGTLAGGIAHDFNNILSAIIGFTELAKDDLPATSGTAEKLDNVLEAGTRAKELVRQILAFSRRTEQCREPVQPRLIIKEAVKLLRATIPTTIEIRQILADHDSTVTADPTQLHQLVMNLCTNAYHAMRERGGILEVRLNDVMIDETGAKAMELAPGPYLQLAVSDTGCGMDKEMVERIFEPYFTSKEMGQGTGLGLAVVHGIVKGHNGHVGVDSTPDRGTTVTVHLPHASMPSAAAPSESTEGTDQPTGRERILVVDDEELVTSLNRHILERLGYRVTTLTDSSEALALFSSNPDQFDLVITDMNMPVISGAELAAQLLTIRPDIRIILATGYSEVIDEA
ncbi:MAG: DUF3365 domain-containing protein, partial [Desulfobulbaceae bacterium]|nr:DUF3365 domain-containing protein [Desulfobulbaceae bacterium]